LRPGKIAFLAARQMPCGLAAPVGGRFFRRHLAASSCDVSGLRAFGADDGKSRRTPSAWMISLAPSLALRQIVFFVWVSLTEHKWVALAERRGPKAAATRRRWAAGRKVALKQATPAAMRIRTAKLPQD
jgi:hypothetical protein